jgi:type II secretory pathway component PulK
MHFNAPHMRSQQGAVLLVGLMVLVMMTLFAVASMSDVGIQNAMVRNNQLEILAYNSSMNEINAQVDNINESNDEDILLDALKAGDGLRTLTDGSAVLDANGVEVNQADEIFSDASGDFTVTAELAYLRDQALVAGYTLGEFRGLVYELDVNSTRTGTSTNSNQVQGLYYIAPN